MLGIGCSPQPEPPPDSGETGLEVEDDPCAPEGFPSGQAVGESNCEEGICSIPPALSGEARPTTAMLTHVLCMSSK